MSKKRMIEIGIVCAVLLGLFVLYSVSPKKEVKQYADCGIKKLDLDKLNICLKQAQELVKNEDNSLAFKGKFNECLLELKSVNEQNYGGDVTVEEVDLKMKIKAFYEGKHIEVKSEIKGLHIIISRIDSIGSPYCSSTAMDPVVEDSTISLLANSKNNSVFCMDDKYNAIIYYSDDLSEADVEESFRIQGLEMKKIIDTNKKLIEN